MRVALGHRLLQLLLGTTLALAISSALTSFTHDLASAHGITWGWPPLGGVPGQIAHILPSSHGFGFFAPVVRPQYRFLTRMTDSRTGETGELRLGLGREARLTLAAMSQRASDDDDARRIARMYARYALRRNPGYDSAVVTVQVEAVPPLRSNAAGASWETVATIRFER